MYGPPINVAAYNPKVAGHRTRPTVQGGFENVACHVELHPLQVEPFGTNEVKITIDGASRIVDAFALGRAMDEALNSFRRR